MSKQTEAERLAEWLERRQMMMLQDRQAAAELRRQASFIKDLKDEVVEQCRINGMSAEREDALRAEVDRLNKAVADEREACAKIADRFSIPMCDSSADDIAVLIRARGNT